MREASRPTFDKSEYLSEDYGPQALRPMMSKDTQVRHGLMVWRLQLMPGSTKKHPLRTTKQHRRGVPGLGLAALQRDSPVPLMPALPHTVPAPRNRRTWAALAHSNAPTRPRPPHPPAPPSTVGPCLQATHFRTGCPSPGRRTVGSGRPRGGWSARGERRIVSSPGMVRGR